MKFTPKPVVTIYGFTPESLAESTALASQVPERIGAWMFNYGGGSEVIVISQRGQSLRRTDLIVGGKSIEYGADLHETQTSTGRLFRGPDLSKTGDSWLLKPNGDLVVADNDGVISIARPIRF